jgi:hypothetical protein
MTAPNGDSILIVSANFAAFLRVLRGQSVVLNGKGKSF